MATDTNQSVSDQKRRTLEALERRFAVAKAELLQQQQKSRKRSREEEEEIRHNNNSSSVTSSHDAPVITYSTQSSKKGHFAFSSRTPSRGTPRVPDVEADGLTYSHLCQPLHGNLLSSGSELSCKKGRTVDNVIHELLQSGDSAQKYMQGSRSKKIDNWILLDNFVQSRGISVSARIRALQSHSKRSKSHMSMKQLKKCGSFDLPSEFHRFDIFKSMHEMWKGYIMQLVKIMGKSELAQCFLTADLHGAILLVAECKVTAFSGISGIMIRETAETFGIITQDNKLRVLLVRGIRISQSSRNVLVHVI
uniref:Uncharacterized protein n=1 Tax=Nelumbo nucifera TaxID=4432 RepID=A0A822Y455_NELNU|nr:TPA_asm: hypothetical protein HUJ06_027557 [Nelumbo nucifera]